MSASECAWVRTLTPATLLQWRNGDSYTGSWLRDFMHGEGVYSSLHGTKITGLFAGGDVIQV